MSISATFGDGQFIFTLEARDPGNLGALYQSLGGDAEYIESALRGAVTAVEHGDAAGVVASKLGGRVISETQDNANTAQVETGGSGGSDPWSSDSHASSRATATAERSSGGSSQGPTFITDQWNNKWTLGAEGAPSCDCGEPAAKVRAKSRAGNWYTAWKCAKGVGDDWGNKCGFSEYVN